VIGDRAPRESAAETLGRCLLLRSDGVAEGAVLRGRDANARMLAAIQAFPEITGLSIIESDLDAAALKSTLQRLSKLASLKLISCPRVGDDIVPEIAALPDLRDLNCDGSGVTDRGVLGLVCSPSLSSLKLSRTAITDRGVAALAKLPALAVLEVCNTAVSDEGLRSLRSHDRLTVVWASDTGISDAGMAHLATCPRLAEVLVRGVQLSDVGMERLCDAKSLETVYASGVFSRRTLTALGTLPELRILLLEGELRIGDDDVGMIGRMRSLTRVQLLGSQISPAGVSRLSESLPQAFVEISPVRGRPAR